MCERSERGRDEVRKGGGMVCVREVREGGMMCVREGGMR